LHSLKIYTEDYPPFYYMEDTGHLGGFVTEQLKEAAALAGIPIEFHLRPFNRGLMAVETYPNNCFMALWRTEIRAPNFRWVGPLQIDGIAYFALEESTIRIKQHSDAFQYRTGAVRGWTSTLEAKSAGHGNLVPVERDDLNPGMLKAGRIKLWLGGLLSSPYLAEQAGVSVRNVFTVQTVDLSLGCHPLTSTSVIARLQTALEALQADSLAAESQNELSHAGGQVPAN
ncbi:substrate-binding periplasmic protein, partial [Roseibium denhamense]